MYIYNLHISYFTIYNIIITNQQTHMYTQGKNNTC